MNQIKSAFEGCQNNVFPLLTFQGGKSSQAPTWIYHFRGGIKEKKDLEARAERNRKSIKKSYEMEKREVTW